MDPEDTINTAVAETENVEVPAPSSQPATAADTPPTDVDELEAWNAKRALEAEEAGKPETPEKPAAPAAQAAPAATSAPAEPDTTGQMVPLNRLNQETEKVAREREENARLKGENEALKLMIGKPASAGPNGVQPPVVTPEQEIQSARTERVSLAEKYDNGEISLADYRKADNALVDKEHAARERILEAKFATRPSPAPQPANDLLLDERSAKLEQEHEYVTMLSAPDLQFLHVKAIEQLMAEGGNIPTDRPYNAREALAVRERIAKLSDSYGPVMTGKTIAPKAPSATGQTPVKPALSPTAQARQAKLEAAASAPPDLSHVGSTQPLSEPTEDQILSMSDEEIAKLPASTRNKWMGITA